MDQMVAKGFEQINSSVNRLLATGAATIAAMGIGAEGVAQAIPTEYNRVPKVAAEAIRHNAARLTEIGCSAWLIRDKQGEIDGVATAAHCSLEDREGEADRIVGSDGKQYIVQPKPIKAQIGSKSNTLRTVAVIDKYILPGTPEQADNYHDLALGVVQGHTPAEVLKDYKENSLPAEKVEVGDKLFAGAFPTIQPQNNSVMRRQMFNLTVKSQGSATMEGGKFIHMVFADMPATKDGAECSPGASGSAAFALVKGRPKIVGVLSSFYDFTGHYGEYNPVAQAFHPDYVAATCGFSDQLDMPKRSEADFNNGSIVDSVTTVAEIPGYLTPEKMIESLREQFDNPKVNKKILDAQLAIPSLKGGPDTAPYSVIVDNPVLFHFPVPGTTFVVWANSAHKDPNHLEYVLLSDSRLSSALVIPHNENEEPAFLASNGEISYRFGNKASSPSFIDESQQSFGSTQIGQYPESRELYFHLEFEDDGFHLYPNLK